MIAFQSRYILRVLISIMFLATSIVSLAPSQAQASSGLFPTLGYSAMGPQQGMPYYTGQNCGMVGQMPANGQCGVDPMAVFYGLNWGGAQRLGSSYMTPIGLPTMMNSMNYGRMMDAMSGY